MNENRISCGCGCFSIGWGTAIAAILSYVKWQSIGWAILHAILGWLYVIYYVVKYII